jgi:RNA-directed DNA polymerase
MKRHGSLFSQITDIDNLNLAFKKAKKGKSWQYAVKKVESDLLTKLLSIQNSLIDKSFTTSEYKEKIIYEPKKRTIYRLPFYPDRIVQHALMNILEPIWDNIFIFDSYACRKGKGIHAGSKRTMSFLRQNKYCLKCDISKFYPSIDHNILFDIIKRKIKCKNTLWLIENIIYSYEGNTNVPIGNYTSQWFGNLYLNELDYFLKHMYKIKFYIRYCDDFVIFLNDRKFLNDLSQVIKDFLKIKLNLSLSKCDLFPVSKGIDFLGYRHFQNYILLRKSTALRIKRRLKMLPNLFFSGKITRIQLMSSIASTRGWLKWANSYNLSLSLNLDFLDNLCNGIEKI